MSQALEDIKDRAVRLTKKRMADYAAEQEEAVADAKAAETRKRASAAPEAEVVEAPKAASKSKAA